MPDSSSEAAREGTLAHKLAELRLIRKYQRFNKAIEKRWQKELDETVASDLYTHAMGEHIDEYVAFIEERYNACTSPTILLEQRLDLTSYVPEAWGTADVVLVDDGVLELIDLKYGKGVPVSAVDNTQLKVYGLGAVEALFFLYRVHTVRLTIYQPRISNYSSWEISYEDLKQWGEDVLVPRAEMAFKGLGEFVAGDHCRFCPGRNICKTLADYQLELAKYEYAPANTLTPDDVAAILRREKEFTTWLKGVTEYALDQAVNHGAKWPGYKLVEGRSNRVYTDETTVAARVKDAGFEPYKPLEVLGITAMEKLLKPKTFKELLADLLDKPPGKPTLAPVEDKRPEINSLDTAVADFSNAENLTDD
jgi:hypothetical protein